MKRSEARVVLLVIAAWVMGALMGSQIQRPTTTLSVHATTQGTIHVVSSAPVAFRPGLYLIESADRDQYLYINFRSGWQVSPYADGSSERKEPR